MILVVTAVDAERDAVRRGLGATGSVEVTTVGVGPAAAAAGAAWRLARATRAVRLVVCAGIGGGVADRCRPGDLVVATRTVAADLGADGPGGFVPLDELGFGVTSRIAVDLALPGAVRGAVLTVSTVTGTAATADALVARHPDAVAEAMEGFGVASAAAVAGVPFAEVRAVSNLIGPRDRAAWRIADALDALARAGEWLRLAGEADHLTVPQ
jgi:futalosine hydrolase